MQHVIFVISMLESHLDTHQFWDYLEKKKEIAFFAIKNFFLQYEIAFLRGELIFPSLLKVLVVKRQANAQHYAQIDVYDFKADIASISAQTKCCIFFCSHVFMYHKIV